MSSRIWKAQELEVDLYWSEYRVFKHTHTLFMSAICNSVKVGVLLGFNAVHLSRFLVRIQRIVLNLQQRKIVAMGTAGAQHFFKALGRTFFSLNCLFLKEKRNRGRVVTSEYKKRTRCQV